MDSIIVSNRSKQQKYREICKCSLLFLPPHSRQLNPIEVWFQSLREKIRKDSFSSNEELCQGIHYILKEQENYEFKQIVN
jgi:transposase